MSQRRDRINSALLGDTRTQAWSNLGHWQGDNRDYSTAAKALAVQLAKQMDLQAADSVLDVACGYGASLNLWHEWGLREVLGLEQQAACVAAWQDDDRFHCWHGRMQDSVGLAGGRRFDAVLAIDAAYQWDLSAWLAQAHGLLHPQGRLGFHFLLLADDFAQRPRAQQAWTRRLLRLVGVQTLLNQAQLQAACHAHWDAQWTDLCIRDISSEVLGGFGRYAQSLPHTPLGFDGLKIHATGWLCRHLYRQSSVRYVSISLRKA